MFVVLQARAKISSNLFDNYLLLCYLFYSVLFIFFYFCGPKRILKGYRLICDVITTIKLLQYHTI